MTEARIKIEYRPLGSLKLNPRNARLHSDNQVAEIARSISRFGFLNPLLVDKDGTIIAGEGRYLAARKLGVLEAPVIELAGLSEQQCRALALADNRIALNSKWDEAMLRTEIEALRSAGEIIDDLGFTHDELQDLLVEEAAPLVLEIPVGEVHDRFWISVRGPLKDQATALQRLTTMMADMPAVEVELGTIGLEP
ncbi:ParB-like chromosome segregation protein Spo0J [Bradyrhizobium barranii subsp. barranii]|uniref:ParB/Srx family N-terminal domain-containing protein n=1 Tax=Bradyrhizobium liaoningense TaxID=43992 RepID=UPI001BAAEB6E|nr:ParB/Srx family N-terminal domain-containing protein [Bradyrhizobium liaoningense]MBR0879133.1 ParB N-terminal domain-containing protein [Bradyrhizobium liaoningense]